MLIEYLAHVLTNKLVNPFGIGISQEKYRILKGLDTGMWFSDNFVEYIPQ